MIHIHASVIVALMGISAIAGFFATAIYIDRQTKRRPMPRPIDPVGKEEMDRIRQRSEEMGKTLQRQAEPETPASILAAEEEKANRALEHLLRVLKGEHRPVAIFNSERPVSPGPEGSC